MPNFLQRVAFKAMGSQCEIQLFCDSRFSAKHIGRQLIQEVERLESKYSRFRSDSVVSTINASPEDGITIDQETKALFDHAHSCYQQSGGLFDITAGALTRLWDFKAAKVPSPDTIAHALKNVGLNKLSWQDRTVLMPASMEIDFGGIVKEYAADTVANLARMLGCKSGLVNLGGDFAVIGPHPTTKTWPIGIVNPQNQSGVMAALDLHSGGLASSGDYARYFVHEGRRYSHILNPQTGWPSSGLRAVSVSHSLCTVAGSLATIAMLKDEQQAIAWLQESGVPCVYMTQDGRIGRH